MTKVSRIDCEWQVKREWNTNHVNRIIWAKAAPDLVEVLLKFQNSPPNWLKMALAGYVSEIEAETFTFRNGQLKYQIILLVLL